MTTGDVSSEPWAERMRSLTPDQQAELLATAVKLLSFPDAVSTPLESEVRVFAEQLHQALGLALTTAGAARRGAVILPV